MAKKPTPPTKPKKEESRAVATRATGPSMMVGKNRPSAELQAQMKKDAGKGLSSRASDNLIPLIYIIQAQSPQALKKNPAYIEGAEAGSIWLRNAADPIIAGEEGFLFQPCSFSIDWVEWIPRDDGGGFVGRHAIINDDPEICPVADAKKVEDEKNPNRVSWVRKNGNEVVQTRYHIGYVLGRGAPMPYVIPLTSTGHTFSKQWMTLMNTLQLDDGSIAASWAAQYRIITKHKQNARGEWYGFDVSFDDWVSREDYARGLAIHNAFAKGEKSIEQPESDMGGGGSNRDMS